MDLTWARMNQDSPRAASVIRHPSATFAEILLDSATDDIDLSAYVTACRQSSRDVSVTLRYHSALDGANQPQPGELLEVRLNGQLLFLGIIDTIQSYTLQSGSRSLSVVAYSRENTPAWKSVKRVTQVYPTGTPLQVIAEDIARAIGLGASEINLPATSVYTVHSNTQLAEKSAWEMLQALYLSSGYEPSIDSRGRLKAVSRDLARVADITVEEERLLSVNGSKKRPPTTSVRVKWLDPNLTKVSQQDQPLGNATLTAGFFQHRQRQDIYFSDDRTQRAEQTYMVVKQSANSGLLNFCREGYAVISPTQGRITLTTSVWAPFLATHALGGLIAASFVPDGVVAFGGGETIPIGRLVEAVSQVAILLVMMCMGTGIYEIRGVPYDYVHGRNTTQAVIANVPDWLVNVEDLENDFVMNEAQAQAFAGRELILKARSAQSYDATIVDDPRIERGDILALPDGSRLYVEDYSRDLTSGAPPVLQVRGFRA